MFNPRPSQKKILEYQSGRMGISAVPGSGKTHTLSYLAAQLIVQGLVDSEQEILVVTLVNSAVDNFASRIAGFIHESGLLENVGYRVRTLHGLAHDIIRERPDLVGLSDHFSIVDDLETSRMIDTIATSYIRIHPEIPETLLKPDVELSKISHGPYNFYETVSQISQNFITLAKDLQADPETLQKLAIEVIGEDPLFMMCLEVYDQYQRGLRYRNALDFSDLVRLAVRALDNDEQYLKRLQKRWPYILEDEAQDSSSIQETVLRKLVGENGNWVRVGDPNQAIYETFTTAKPEYLIKFLESPGVVRNELPNSGRSCQSIIDLANFLIAWTNHEHSVPELRASLHPPFIQPTGQDDPQSNPPDHAHAIWIQENACTPDEEISKVVKSIGNWLPDHQDKTVAVLTPIGKYGEQVTEALLMAGIDVVELLKTSQSTRRTTRLFESILRALANPSETKFLAAAFQPMCIQGTLTDEEKQELGKVKQAIQKCPRAEQLLYPRKPQTWQEALNDNRIPLSVAAVLDEFRDQMIRWHQAALLPIDQLILTIAQDLFTEPSDLALSHKLALMLEFKKKQHPELGLMEFAKELADISAESRKFSGFSNEELRFNPDDYKGKVFVSTYHRAKGLEWDRVYLLSVNNYDFPSYQLQDTYRGEKWYFHENTNPEAEVLEKIRRCVNPQGFELSRKVETATLQSRLDYAAERLRLLFVGITRAKETLVITWNTGKNKEKTMAVPLKEIQAKWRR
jgi:DNA helicase II / ATP-dependent DNA helicase PcrA